MRNLMLYILLALPLLYGCQRMDLYERSTTVNINFNLDIDIDVELDMEIETELEKEYLAKVQGVKPEYMEVLFYNTINGRVSASFVLPAEGGQVNIAPGDYHIVAYNFGTESTQVERLEKMDEAKAYTTDITKIMQGAFHTEIKNNKENNESSEEGAPATTTKGYEDDPIIYEPDHLYVANENNINIPDVSSPEEEVSMTARASTILDVYSLEVLGVTGCENVEKVEAFITGQIRHNYFGIEKRGDSPATLYVDLSVDAENGRFYTVFGTFGKLPGATNDVYLDVTIIDTGGGRHRYIYDITEQFDDPENKHKKLIIIDDINIPKGSEGGGGLSPSVGKWDNEEIDIPLS